MEETKLEKFKDLIYSSKSYEFVNTTQLKLTGYFTGKTITIDLANLLNFEDIKNIETEEELFEYLIEDEEDEDVEDDYYE